MARSRTLKSPKYVALAEQIQLEIRSGVLRPGDKLPTIIEMCERHEVTPTTITSVYALLKKERLIVSERGQGTFVASPPRRAETGIIGVSGIVGNTRILFQKDRYSARLMHGMTMAASKFGFELLMLNDTSSRDWGRVDGVIAHGCDAPALLQRLPPEMPSVILHHSVPDAFCVVADERAGVTALMQHLHELGHQRIAAMLDSLSPDRLSAYRDALYAADIEPNQRWIRRFRGDIEQENPYVKIGFESMKLWLEEDWDELGCTAIVTQNDATARGVVEALRQTGKRIPEDVSVTGFDGTEVESFFEPFLTTIEVPLEDMGAAVVESLYKRIAGEEERTGTLMMPIVVKKCTSTAPPAVVR
jgi:LacI family transcriptional regulator